MKRLLRSWTITTPTVNLFDVVGNVAADPFLAAVPGVVHEAAAKGWQYATAAGRRERAVSGGGAAGDTDSTFDESDMHDA